MYLAFTTQPGTSGTSPYALSPQPVVAAKKSRGTTDTAKAGTVTISLVALTGSPVLSGTTTKVLASGVADFSANALTVTGAGTWYLVATLSGLTGATSNTGTTTAVTADHLTITTQPVGSTSPNLATQPVVAARNAGNTTDTSYVGTVVPTLNVLTGSATLGGTEAAGKACVAGVCTFTNLTVTSAAGATWTITFTSGTLTSATSSTGTTTSGGVGTTYTDTFTGALTHPAPTLMSDGVHSWTNVGGADPFLDGSGNMGAWADFNKPAGRIVTTDSPNQAITTTWAALSSSQPSVFLRYIDSTHYLRVGYLGGTVSKNVTLWRNVGAGEVVVTGVGVATAANDVLFASVDAANLVTVKYNGTTLFAVTEAANSTGVGAGISGDWNGATQLADWTCVTS